MRVDQQVHSRCGLLINTFVETWAHTLIEPLGIDWEYFSLNPTVSCELKSTGDGSYEPIVVVCGFIILKSCLSELVSLVPVSMKWQ